MTPERFREVGRLYHAAVVLEAAARPRYLGEACAGDEALRAEVEALLSYDDESRFLDRPALELATQILNEKPARSLAGQRVGHCQLLVLLGKGGMGEVWLAEDTQLGRQVAVKLLPDEFTTDAARVRRFTQEARAASALNHPNILTIHDIGTFVTTAATTHYIITEYIEGETLRERLRKLSNAQLPLAVALDVTLQMAAALAAAHKAGIIHRDIKPENVMVREDGIVKVLDFGLAKLTERRSDGATERPGESSTAAGIVMGTPRYMSPEQARGEKVDARTDIFSLGVMLYEMIAGVPPFVGATTSEMIAAILRDEPLPLRTHAPATPAELQRIVDHALQKDRAARYQTMAEWLTDLKSLQRQLERQEEGPDEANAELSGVTTARLAQPAHTAEPATDTAEQPGRTTKLTAFSDRLKHYKWGIAIALVLLAAVTLAVYFGQRETAIDSLAVLPFVNVGANPEAEYLSDGITDSLINGLSQLPNLKVMSRNSVFHYKGKETDAQQVGQSLGVRAVLLGKMTQRADDLLISAELVDVRDNSQLWSAQYNHKLADLLTVPSELARDIAQQLRLRLSGEDKQRLTKRGTENAEAYELYLKGHYYNNAQERENEEKALEYFQRALAKDPRFALPYAELAGLYVGMASIGTTYTIPPHEALQKAKEAAAKAIALDDTLAEAHLSLAEIARVFDWDWNTAEREYRRAIELTPNVAAPHHFYAHHLVGLGRFDEALAESLRALALDPLDVGMNFHLGWYYFYTRQYAQAAPQLQKTLSLDANHSGAHGILGLTYGQQGRYSEAVAEMRRMEELKGRDMRGNLGRVYALAGQRNAAQKLLAELQEEAQHKPVSPYNIAIIYASLGEQEQAFAWLEKAIAERDGNLTDPGLKVDVIFEQLHADVRFAALLRRMGLPQ